MDKIGGFPDDAHHQDHPSHLGDDKKCQKCGSKFAFRVKRHRCKVCFGIFCQTCSNQKVNRPNLDPPGVQVRVCDNCSCLIAGVQSTANWSEMMPPDFDQAQIEMAKSISLQQTSQIIDFEQIELEKALLYSLQQDESANNFNKNFQLDPETERLNCLEQERIKLEQLELDKSLATSLEEEKARQRQLEIARVKAVLGTRKHRNEGTDVKTTEPSIVNVGQVMKNVATSSGQHEKLMADSLHHSHSEYYKNVISGRARFFKKYDDQGTSLSRANRESTADFNGFAFIGNPIRKGDSVVFKVIQQEPTKLGHVWHFGVTSCDPTKILGRSLPLDPYDLLDRPEYWAVNHWDSNENLVTVGDEFRFRFHNSGKIFTSKNDGPENNFMNVEESSVPLWFFVHLQGPISDIHLLGMV